MSDKNATGKKVSQEQSISAKLKEMVLTDVKVYFILWKYAPQLLPNKNLKTFDDLKNNYAGFTKGMTEDVANNWLYEKNVQTAVKWLLVRLNQSKMIELYNIYFETAKKDTQAFKAFVEFSKSFLLDDKEGDLQALLQNINIPDDEIEDDTE